MRAFGIKTEKIVDRCEQDRIEIIDAAEQQQVLEALRIKRWMRKGDLHCHKMRPGAMARKRDAAATETKIGRVLLQESEGARDFPYHRLDRSLGCQRVVEGCESKSGGEDLCGHRSRFLLAQFLPVTAMDEDEERRICLRCRKEVEHLRCGRTVAHVLAAGKIAARHSTPLGI